jgi:hypothetical protein
MILRTPKIDHPAEQVPVRGSQNGVVAGQSMPNVHCTQVLLTGSHRGWAPLQSRSVRQPTQIPAALRQNGVAGRPGQTVVSSSPQVPHTPE